ncbi:hypothetical protein AK812_SmicGene12543 [Symbiodinium microadriaticum]|uniref:Uncharacterized protein n=1 Tax=Symbiodinium microadriaticum TaxID=2951 RepID=A0A1Q9EAD6_SYMMI|nr:hypothetical protein AK812_SmicGene12543 [Symbiodinium microadriaticum]
MAMPSSDGGAMEQGPSCPVLAAWKQSSVVMSQLLKDRLVILQYPTLSRLRPTVIGIAEYLKRFYNNELPLSRKAPSGNGSSAGGDASEESSQEDVSAGEGGESEEASEDMVVDPPELPDATPENLPKPASEEIVAAPDLPPAASTSPAPVASTAAEIDAGSLPKLCLPGVIPRTAPSESSSSVIVTPPPKGLPFSPQSDARKKGKHYFVKDRTYGYHCLNCDCASQELDVLKAMPCVAPKGSEKRVEATLNAEIELENLRDLEAEGLQLQELLNFEQEQLEQMMLQAEIDELERQVAQEEYELHEAKIRSLEDAAIEAKKRPLCEPPTASDSKHAAATARDAQLVDHTATAGNAKQVDQTATAGNA